MSTLGSPISKKCTFHSGSNRNTVTITSRRVGGGGGVTFSKPTRKGGVATERGWGGGGPILLETMIHI